MSKAIVGSNVESRDSGGTADVLPNERKKASFEIEKMTNVLDGGEAKTKRRRFLLSPMKNVDLSDKYFWSREEMLKQHVKHFISVHEAYWDSFIPTREDVAVMMEHAVLSGAMMNHYGLFLGTIVGQGSDEQKLEFALRAVQMKIVGCYAQTELGHGSNVRGLQTTAVYDKNTQEFILNTPTLLSIKWWPGALGKVATHAVVYAQLLLDGKEYGVHPFVMQIRDENHKPLPGIELGDLGPKLGDHANDTGYMVLTNVRIPREYLLSNFQSVTPEGQYVMTERKKKNPKLHYATMMYSRGAMIKGASGYLARAVTIAVRYSCVRKQGFVSSKKGISYKSEEKAIIDYQVQRYRLLKQLALTYAIKFSGKWMLSRFSELEGGGDKTSPWIIQNLDALPEIAATSAGLKALCTFLASQGIEDCRKCCGGNGYLMASGIASLALDYLWQTTAEGDWIILMLQTAKHLLKSLRNARKGEVTNAVDYLAPLKDKNFSLDKLKAPAASSEEDYVSNLPFLLQLFKFNSLYSLASAGFDLEKKAQETKDYDVAFNQCSLQLVNAVRQHCLTFMLSNFIQEIEDVKDASLRPVLIRLCALFACSCILDESSWIGIISPDQMLLVKSAVRILLDQIRPDAVALVDAFDIPDNVLNSTIGRYDGNVYEALYEAAKKAPLNKKDPFDGYEILKPYLDIEFLKKPNQVPSKL